MGILPVAAYFVSFSLQSSTYQVLAMTVDKYVAIKWPHKAFLHYSLRPQKSQNWVL